MNSELQDEKSDFFFLISYHLSNLEQFLTHNLINKPDGLIKLIIFDF